MSTPHITWDIAIALRNNWFNWNRVWMSYGLLWLARTIVGGNMFVYPVVPDNYMVVVVPIPPNTDNHQDDELANYEVYEE